MCARTSEYKSGQRGAFGGNQASEDETPTFWACADAVVLTLKPSTVTGTGVRTGTGERERLNEAGDQAPSQCLGCRKPRDWTASRWRRSRRRRGTPNAERARGKDGRRREGDGRETGCGGEPERGGETKQYGEGGERVREMARERIRESKRARERESHETRRDSESEANLGEECAWRCA